MEYTSYANNKMSMQFLFLARIAHNRQAQYVEQRFLESIA